MLLFSLGSKVSLGKEQRNNLCWGTMISISYKGKITILLLEAILQRQLGQLSMI